MLKLVFLCFPPFLKFILVLIYLHLSLRWLRMFDFAQRAQLAGILHNYCPNILDPRGRLLLRAFDVLGYVFFHIHAHEFMLPLWCIDYAVNLLQVCMLPLYFKSLIQISLRQFLLRFYLMKNRCTKRQVFLSYPVKITILISSFCLILTLLFVFYQQPEWQESRRHQVSSVDEERNGHADNMVLDHPNKEKGILGPGPADLRFPEPFKGLPFPAHNPDESSWWNVSYLWWNLCYWLRGSFGYLYVQPSQFVEIATNSVNGCSRIEGFCYLCIYINTCCRTLERYSHVKLCNRVHIMYNFNVEEWSYCWFVFAE